MTPTQRLALVDSDARDGMGDDNAGPLEVIAGDSELLRWLKVSNRFALLEKRMANMEQMVNRITTRFATEGRPLPEDTHAA